MSRNPLDYRGPSEPPRAGHEGASRPACWAVAAVVVLVNAGLLLLAMVVEPSGAFEIALAAGPIGNLMIAVVATTCAPVVKQAFGAASLVSYVPTGIMLPIVAILADSLVIMWWILG